MYLGLNSPLRHDHSHTSVWAQTDLREFDLERGRAAGRRFVDMVDQALPGGDKRGAPRRRVEILEAGLKMIEQLLGVSNDAARRLTESVRQALPAIERNVNAAARKKTAKRPAKKTTAKKTPARRGS